MKNYSPALNYICGLVRRLLKRKEYGAIRSIFKTLSYDERKYVHQRIYGGSR